MTLTDLFYMAAVDVTKNQHALITRYPVSDAYGVFVAKVNPVSTLQTEVVQINGQVYTHYPRQDMTCTRENIGVQFIDTLQFSNSYLAGLGGDYRSRSWSHKTSLIAGKFYYFNRRLQFVSAG